MSIITAITCRFCFLFFLFEGTCRFCWFALCSFINVSNYLCYGLW